MLSIPVRVAVECDCEWRCNCNLQKMGSRPSAPAGNRAFSSAANYKVRPPVQEASINYIHIGFCIWSMRNCHGDTQFKLSMVEVHWVDRFWSRNVEITKRVWRLNLHESQYQILQESSCYSCIAPSWKQQNRAIKTSNFITSMIQSRRRCLHAEHSAKIDSTDMTTKVLLVVILLINNLSTGLIRLILAAEIGSFHSSASSLGIMTLRCTYAMEWHLLSLLPRSTRRPNSKHLQE